MSIFEAIIDFFKDPFRPFDTYEYIDEGDPRFEENLPSWFQNNNSWSGRYIYKNTDGTVAVTFTDATDKVWTYEWDPEDRVVRHWVGDHKSDNLRRPEEGEEPMSLISQPQEASPPPLGERPIGEVFGGPPKTYVPPGGDTAEERVSEYQPKTYVPPGETLEPTPSSGPSPFGAPDPNGPAQPPPSELVIAPELVDPNETGYVPLPPDQRIGEVFGGPPKTYVPPYPSTPPMEPDVVVPVPPDKPISEFQPQPGTQTPEPPAQPPGGGEGGIPGLGVPYQDFIPFYPMVQDPNTGEWRNAEPGEIPGVETPGGDTGFGDVASAGNGGTATAEAGGGSVPVEGGTSAGHTSLGVPVEGGTVAGNTSLGVSAEGGIAEADAGGGSVPIGDIGSGDNAGAIGVGDASSGAVSVGDVGGTGTADASGGDIGVGNTNAGAVEIGDIGFGGNAGSVIGVGDTYAVAAGGALDPALLDPNAPGPTVDSNLFDPEAPGPTLDPALVDPSAPGPTIDPNLLDPAAPGPTLDPNLLDPNAPGGTVDPSTLDPAALGPTVDPALLDPSLTEPAAVPDPALAEPAAPTETFDDPMMP